MTIPGVPSTCEAVLYRYDTQCCARPPGVVMVASLTTLCNTERAQRESRAREGSTKRGQGQYKAGAPKAPSEVLEELQ
jgi:hypothetical protein